MARPEKEAVVVELTEKLAHTRAVFLTDFTGLDVGALNRLRRECRNISAEYRVVKNTLTRFAVQKAGFPELVQYLEGPTGLVLVDEDPVIAAKVLVDFIKERERPTIKAGLLQGQLIDAGQIQATASLPTKEVLLGQLLRGLTAPMAGVVRALQGLLSQLVRTLDAMAQKQEDHPSYDYSSSEKQLEP